MLLIINLGAERGKSLETMLLSSPSISKVANLKPLTASCILGKNAGKFAGQILTAVMGSTAGGCTQTIAGRFPNGPTPIRSNPTSGSVAGLMRLARAPFAALRARGTSPAWFPERRVKLQGQTFVAVIILKNLPTCLDRESFAKNAQTFPLLGWSLTSLLVPTPDQSTPSVHRMTGG